MEYGQKEGMTASRKQRVEQAKKAFGKSYGEWKDYETTPDGEQEESPGRSYGLARFLAAAMLLFLLCCGFSNGFSYHGFNRQYVEKQLNDDSTWKLMEHKVQSVYLSLTKAENK